MTRTTTTTMCCRQYEVGNLCESQTARIPHTTGPPRPEQNPPAVWHRDFQINLALAARGVLAAFIGHKMSDQSCIVAGHEIVPFAGKVRRPPGSSAPKLLRIAWPPKSVDELLPTHFTSLLVLLALRDGLRKGPFPVFQGPLHQLQQRFVHHDLGLAHDGLRLRKLVGHLLLDVLGMLNEMRATVDDLQSLHLVVLRSVRTQNLSLDVGKLPVARLATILLIHLLEQVGLVLDPQLLQAVLLDVLCLEEVAVHLLLLCQGALGIVVASALLDAVHIRLELGHQVVLALQASLHLGLPLLLLLVQSTGVLLELR
mmetsp:Transcript_101143/g.271688  ORF Transcript_101143/g.271688 Transcript_101143/m.271688 type:complete len:313 (-) Transcript_101143:988-1926(-)